MTCLDPAVKIQREYYTETSSRYDTMHKHEGCDDPECRQFIISILHSLQIRSLLDVCSPPAADCRTLRRRSPEHLSAEWSR